MVSLVLIESKPTPTPTPVVPLLGPAAVAGAAAAVAAAIAAARAAKKFDESASKIRMQQAGRNKAYELTGPPHPPGK